MKTVSVFAMLFALCIFISCDKKAPDDPIEPIQPERFCWQIVDYSGNKLDTVCGKTEAELINCVIDGSCDVYAGLTTFSSCNYYKIEGDKFCWLINGVYIDSVTENEAKLIWNCYLRGSAPVRTVCRNCEFWFHRKKMTFKPANTVTYSPIRRENFCGDTTNTLFQGRQIIIKDDTDSLVVIQFSTNGTIW